MSAPRPSIRLLPKIDARRLRHGAPWVYANQLVMDRRTRALDPGTLAVLEDAERMRLGLVAFNPVSKIAARVLDQDPEADIDAGWFRRRLAAALGLRERLFDEPYYRLVHAEADGLPGIVIDRFGDAAVIQPNAVWADERLTELADALVDETGVSTVIKNASGRARGLEGLGDLGAILVGGVDAPVPVPMNGATYLADLTGGQKTGLFFDQRPNHAFAARLAQGGKVLDVFSHVGGFALAALAGGATAALAVDASTKALNLARRGAAATGVEDRFEARQGDAFDALAALGAEGRTFDTVICDPPAFAPSKPALDAGLRAYEKVARLAAPLVSDGGYLVLCSCSHAADLAKFRAASLRGVGRAHRASQLIHTGFAGADHPQHPHLAETAYLKALFLRMLP
ncbi:MAG: class I SAM-dependent rRNA methyltransferase [Pseudomonadota bacterium]